jgi:membrane protein implicated in regulation of membrane protease activity
MVGSRGVICTGFANGTGKVRVGDSVWLAEGDGLSEGDHIVVKAVRGTRLVVEPVR